MSENSATVTFWATIAKVQTLADGGLRITLDLSEQAIEQAASMMVYKREGIVLDVECKPRDEKTFRG